ncbi:MAG TPA: hypothetical protein VIU62_02920 [Chloroflexota bacterium]
MASQHPPCTTGTSYAAPPSPAAFGQIGIASGCAVTTILTLPSKMGPPGSFVTGAT